MNDRFLRIAQELDQTLALIETTGYSDEVLIRRALVLHASLRPVYIAYMGQFPLITTSYPPAVWMRRAREGTLQILSALEAGVVMVPTWEWRERALLEAIDAAESAGEPASFDSLVENLDLERNDVELGLRGLIDSGFIAGLDTTTLGGFGVIQLRLRERGKVAIGAWPAAESEGSVPSVLPRQPIQDEFKYDVAVSFAGQDRATVEGVVNALKSEGIRVWYDADQGAQLWGEDLSKVLAETYASEARYVMVFLSPDFTERDWTRFELEVAQKTARTRSTAYVLPVILSPDVPPIVGLPHTIGYVSMLEKTPEEVAQLLRDKLLA